MQCVCRQINTHTQPILAQNTPYGILPMLPRSNATCSKISKTSSNECFTFHAARICFIIVVQYILALLFTRTCAYVHTRIWQFLVLALELMLSDHKDVSLSYPFTLYLISQDIIINYSNKPCAVRALCDPLTALAVTPVDKRYVFAVGGCNIALD
jgi:hypothetical protein